MTGTPETNRARGPNARSREGREGREGHWRQRLGAVALGLVGFLVLLEGVLWILSSFYKPQARIADLAPAEGERRILCIGDSFTYGSHLPPEEAYPGALQRMLDRVEGQPWRVINLGYPGQNSAQVRLGLSRNIAIYEPEIVICWIGSNNTWSLAEAHLWDQPHDEPRPAVAESLVDKSRALGFLRMALHRSQLWMAGQKEQLELDLAAGAIPGLGGVERGGGIEPVQLLNPGANVTPPDEVKRTLFVDLERTLELCREHGAQLVLGEYPVAIPTTRHTINAYLREFAATHGLTQIPLADRIVPLGETFGFPVMWFEDNHCSADGNHEIARQILFGLMDSGLVEEQATWREVETFEQRVRPPGLVVAQLSGRDVELKLQGMPGDLFRVGLFVWLEHEGDSEPWQVSLVLAGLSDEERRAYFGQLNERGQAKTKILLPTVASLQNMGHPGGVPFPKNAPVLRWQLLPFFMAPGAKLSEVKPHPGADIPIEDVER
jgi:hypothetical protein